MPGQGKYGFYSDQLPQGTKAFGQPAGGRGVADYTLLGTLFKGPGGLDSKTVAATANAKLCPDVQDNPDPQIYTDDNVKLGFGSAPDVAKGPFNGEDKAEGGTSNPYFPNLASPDPTGSGRVDPVAPTPVDPAEVNGHAQPGVNGLVNPIVASTEMSNATKIGKTLIPGKHPGSK